MKQPKKKKKKAKHHGRDTVYKNLQFEVTRIFSCYSSSTVMPVSRSGCFISVSGSPLLSDILESIYLENKLSTAHIFSNIKRTRRKFKM